MLALFIVVAIVVVAGVAVLVVRDRPLIADDPVGSRALAWSARDGISPQDLADVRFAVALRGYRMEEVDRVLDDAREALAGRDAQIADLVDLVAALGGTHPASPEEDVVAGEVAAADPAPGEAAADPAPGQAAADPHPVRLPCGDRPAAPCP